MTRRLDHDWFSRPLPENVTIGERSWLYSSYAFSHYASDKVHGVRIGCDTGVYHGTFFDLGPEATVEIGDYCSLVGVVFSTNGQVRIDDYTFVAHEVVIADSPWAQPIWSSRAHALLDTAPQRREISIGKNVWIGAQVLILGSVRIGDGAIIGAGTVVTADVPPNSVCVGSPQRIVRANQSSG
jgi:acetyltransferase-like isoleucine patch superfamily enzyme